MLYSVKPSCNLHTALQGHLFPLCLVMWQDMILNKSAQFNFFWKHSKHIHKQSLAIESQEFISLESHTELLEKR